MHDKIVNLLIFFPVFLFSLSVHEAAHAFVANRLGDPTARLLHRVTLNPIAHMDVVGTLILPIFGLLSGLPMIGWGKPVPVNPMNFKDMRRGSLWVAAFGPISNIILAVLFAALIYGLVYADSRYGAAMADGVTSTAQIAFSMCYTGVWLNLALAFFNLIPIYPLDGHSVVRGIIPRDWLNPYDRMMQNGAFLLLVLFATGALKYIMIPVSLAAHFLLSFGKV